MNDDIRAMAKKSGVRLWQVAAYLGISEATMTRWIRAPLSDERKSKFISAIHELAKEE